MMGGKASTNLISVQAAYWLYEGANGVITCDDVINIPLAYTVPREVKISSRSYEILPAVEFAFSIDVFEFKIITNEGTTVEPFTALSTSDVINPYGRDRVFFVLPKGTTGIKDVIINSKYEGFSSALEFGIMHPPYNYDNALFGVITSEVLALDDKVDDLETKTNNLRIVSHELNASFPYKDLPKGSGKQTLNIDKDMLFFGTNFTYLSSPTIVHSPKITVSDGITTRVYTLSLNKSVRVIIDLLTATLTAYDVSTGEIVQQRKIFETVVGYKSIGYEDFDDISGDKITVLIGGRSVE